MRVRTQVNCKVTVINTTWDRNRVGREKGDSDGRSWSRVIICTAGPTDAD